MYLKWQQQNCAAAAPAHALACNPRLILPITASLANLLLKVFEQKQYMNLAIAACVLAWQQNSKLLICCNVVTHSMHYVCVQVAQGNVDKGTHMKRHVLVCHVEWRMCCGCLQLVRWGVVRRVWRSTLCTQTWQLYANTFPGMGLAFHTF